MYKVFFKDRTVFLGKGFSDIERSVNARFHEFNNKDELFRETQSFITDENTGSLYIQSEDIDNLWSVFKQFFLMIHAGGGLVRNEEGELLIIKRKGKWDLPKGKADGNENIRETAIREVSEECGLSNPKILTHITDTYHSYELNRTWILKRTSWFLMFHSEKEKLVPQAEEGITDIRWIHTSQLSNFLNESFSSILIVFSISFFFLY